MFSELQTWTITGLAAALWIVLSHVGVVAGGPRDAVALLDIVPAVLVAVSIFEGWLWRYPKLHPHLVTKPVLRGTWRGEVRTMWPDPEKTAPARTVYLAVEQTLTTVRARLFSDESSSESIAGSVSNVPSRGWVLSYTYLNIPTIERRAASPIHYGGALLSVIDGAAVTLDGEYWNDRTSKGRLLFGERQKTIARSFGHTASLFAGPTATP